MFIILAPWASFINFVNWLCSADFGLFQNFSNLRIFGNFSQIALILQILAMFKKFGSLG